MMSAWFYMLLKMCTEMIEKRKQNNKSKKKTKSNGTAISSKSKTGLELVSSHHNRANNNLEIAVIGNTND